jgi:hypothetical protein
MGHGSTFCSVFVVKALQHIERCLSFFTVPLHFTMNICCMFGIYIQILLAGLYEM